MKKKETGFEYEAAIYKTNKDVQKKTGILANVKLIINDSLVISDIIIRETKKGKEPGVFFPQRAYKDAKGDTQYKGIAFPITTECREEIVEAVLEAYEETD